MDLKTKKEIVKKLTPSYGRSSKKDKGVILNELIGLTGYERSYARYTLRHPRTKETQILRRRYPSRYKSVFDLLKRIWTISSFACGKILVASLPTLISSLERFGEIKLNGHKRKLLLSISAATCDRLLKTERKKINLKGRSGTKPGTLLKNQIPIKIFTPWNEEGIGFIEIDLVAHCGDSLRDTYINTLDSVDIATCWTEKQAFMGRGEMGTLAAYEMMEKRFPFVIRGIDSDNDVVFINGHFIRMAQRKKITFTRSRPYRQNDQAHIEQKNYSTVRKIVGYKRLETETELKILNQIYLLLSDYLNFFISNQKLLRKERLGSKVKRVYDQAQAPYQRVLNQPHILAEIKRKLRGRFLTLNPAFLVREINRLTRKLLAI